MNTVLSTLAQISAATEEIRKSRFCCQVAPVASPQAALAFLAQVSDLRATHNCWAYRIGQQYRYSDDGEPAGTAGKPMLQAIDGQGFDQVVAVVTRWYGGIKLGAGGLMRAYGGITAQCLRLATRKPLLRRSEVELALPFAQLSLLKARLAEFDAECMAEAFDAEGATLRLALPDARLDALTALIADLTRGRNTVRRRE
ncbi:MAG: YigZ family protein [Rhodanobacteraceae bacterium]|nr:YigZ family protein [Rhodanobacteraceae bacterium]